MEKIFEEEWVRNENLEDLYNIINSTKLKMIDEKSIKVNNIVVSLEISLLIRELNLFNEMDTIIHTKEIDMVNNKINNGEIISSTIVKRNNDIKFIGEIDNTPILVDDYQNANVIKLINEEENYYSLIKISEI